MLNDFKKIFLFGVGSVADSFEKGSKIIDQMVEKGKLTVNEGKELTEELKRTVKDKTEEIKFSVQSNSNESVPLTKEDFISVLNDMNFASKSDLEDIKLRLSKLEQEHQNQV